MAIVQTTPEQARQILDSDDNALYLDVRSRREFEAGHPAGAINIPIADSTDGGPLRPNPEFLTVVERHVARDRRVLVGCQSGGRSVKACEVLSAAGYTDLANVQGGFGGARDRTGRTITPGWTDCGLPTDSGSPGGRSYEDLKNS